MNKEYKNFIWYYHPDNQTMVTQLTETTRVTVKLQHYPKQYGIKLLNDNGSLTEDLVQWLKLQLRGIIHFYLEKENENL